jgi:hypothetical protein
MVFLPAISDPTDFKGYPHIGPDGKMNFIPDAYLDRLFTTTRLTVALFDDIGQATPSTQAATMQLFQRGQIGGRQVSPHVCFIGATNGKAHRANVNGMLEPVKSRFFTIITLEPDLDESVAWFLAHNKRTELIAFLRYRPNFLFDFRPTLDLKNSSIPRTLSHASDILDLGLPEAIEYEALAGAAGEAFAVEFSGFLRMFRRMVSPDVVMMQPDTAPIPDDISTLYALCTALSRLVSTNSVDRFFRYINRLQDEFSVMAVSDAMRMKPELQNTRSFIDWTTKHQAVMI